MNEEVFNKMVLDAADKLFAQNKQSIAVGDGRDGSEKDCAYRGRGGACCPVGFMMDDESARKADLEEDSSVRSIIKAGIWGKELDKGQVVCLALLQKSHDLADRKGEFQKNFIENLKDYNLSWVSDHIEGV